MELVNKSFLIGEYNKCQFDRYLTKIKAIISEYSKGCITHTGQVSYSNYCELEKITLELLERAYGNNHS